MDNLVERVIAAAERHGKQSEAGMEVGDLQELARDLWANMTLQQRASFTGRVIDWREFITDWSTGGNACERG